MATYWSEMFGPNLAGVGDDPDKKRTQQTLLDYVVAGDGPSRMRDVIAMGDCSGIYPTFVRRAFWTLIDDHRLILLADNSVIDHARYRKGMGNDH